MNETPSLPRAVLLDLDDTILNDSQNVEDCWRVACADLEGIDTPLLIGAIDRVRNWFWSDADRHRTGRLDLPTARRAIARQALMEIGVDDPGLANRIGDRYCDERERRMHVLPDAVETVRWLRDQGCRLALLTNGGASGQRAKLRRFDLTGLFDLILIEGEIGYGKPDPRVFDRALRGLAVEAPEAWMVGDHLEWDVAQAQRMGVFGIWVDFRATGVPPDSTVTPDRIVRTLSELRQTNADRS